LSKARSKGAGLYCFVPWASGVLHPCHAARAPGTVPTGHARRGRPAPVGPCAVGPSHAEPPFRPSPLAPRASRTWADRTDHAAAPPVKSPPYALHSVTASPAYALTPVADVRDGRDLLPKARAPIKGAKLAAAHNAAGTEPPPPRHEHPTLSFLANCFSGHPTIQAPPLGSVGTPLAALCTSCAVPSPALRLLRPDLPCSAVPARRHCFCCK
jgi:hypothetical protein